MSADAFVVVGLGFGDEGKGSAVDFLVRRTRARTVVRFNGGSQAAHHVVSPAGVHHCFSQFGAGTLAGAETVLSRFVVVDPLAAEVEARALEEAGVTDPLGSLTVDPRCVVVTPFHRLMNQLLETSRGSDRHGSCGVGIGQAKLDSERPGLPALRAADLIDPVRVRRILRQIQTLEVDAAEQLVEDADPRAAHTGALTALLEEMRLPSLVDVVADRFVRFARHSGVRVRGDIASLPARGTIVFEGAQGVLLDRDWGFWPHVTPSNTTSRNAALLLDELPEPRDVTHLGVLRAYHTRHGAGPFVTEAAELRDVVPPCHNTTHPWQGDFRLGWFDAVAARYALAVAGSIDEVMLTNLDRLEVLGDTVKFASAYGVADDATPSANLPWPSARLPSPPDPEAFGIRGAWARALDGATPVLEDVARAPAESWSDVLPGVLEDALGVDIAWLSVGPRSTDKRRRARG